MKRTKMMLMLISGVLAFHGISFARQHDHQKAEAKSLSVQEQTKEKYSCPMHPEVVSDKPGTCPQCGMTLEKQTVSTADQQEMMSAMMGKPTFEKSVEGVRVQLWLITQDEHKKMMGAMMQDKKDSSTGGGMMHGGMKHDTGKMDHGMMGAMMQDKKDSSTGGQMMHGEMKEMDHGKMGEGKKAVEHNMMMETMTAGTHHVMATLREEKTNQPLDTVTVMLDVISPSSKSSVVRLSPMMKHFGSGLSMNEKGKYSLVVTIEKEKMPLKLSFTYEVK